MSVTPDLPTHDLARRVDEAVAAVRANSMLVPRVALTLGSGLGGDRKSTRLNSSHSLSARMPSSA